ncbi:carboxymuconolactone decarboxylase family protein [Desertivirga brevis]|uniref:carboxymuconolactone decarboxylase family protein n=1 Tax=Desertivirga brevis TaxID=2810310 RepID=UPI001A97A248|nr:carboxymuconolactone decarboxylase family protein [Pedobacter sp. SYSU D00873]
MTKFSESSDKHFAKDIIEAASNQSKAWLKFIEQVEDVETNIPTKYKELISIGIALTTQCPYCIEKHISLAKEEGASKEEIAATIMIAAALRSGAALGYGLLAMKFYKEESE